MHEFFMFEVEIPDAGISLSESLNQKIMKACNGLRSFV